MDCTNSWVPRRRGWVGLGRPAQLGERQPRTGRAGGGREPQWWRRLGAVRAAWGCPSPEAAGAARAAPHRTARTVMELA